jgi:hypothetical protein
MRIKKNDINGQLFGSGNYTLFLPAAGHIDSKANVYSVDNYGKMGYYWSDTPILNVPFVYGLLMPYTDTPYINPYCKPKDKNSVRCVQK